MTAVSYKVDAKGRVSLGKSFANALVLVSTLGEDVIQIVRAEAVPVKEVWLRKNKSAFESVMRGLEQTASGDFAEPPDLEADTQLAEGIKG